MRDLPTESVIRTQPNPTCIACGATGVPLYSGLHDRMGSAPGEWNFKRCPNPDCGLIWLDPLPIEEDIINAYTDYYTHNQKSKLYRGHAARNLYIKLKYHYHVAITPRLFLRALVELLDFTRYAWFDHSVMHLPAKPGGTLLEIGFGHGDNLMEMEQLGWKTQGIEFDEIAVKFASERGLNVRHGTLAEQRYPENHFDAIVMNHVIEHVHDPVSLLTECYRVLADDGKLVLVTPNNRSKTHELFADACFALDPPRHLSYFNSSSLNELVKQAGFVSVESRTSPRNARSFYLASQTIRSTGRYLGVDKSTQMERIKAVLFYIAETTQLLIKPFVGEEIVLLATK